MNLPSKLREMIDNVQPLPYPIIGRIQFHIIHSIFVVSCASFPKAIHVEVVAQRRAGAGNTYPLPNKANLRAFSLAEFNDDLVVVDPRDSLRMRKHLPGLVIQVHLHRFLSFQYVQPGRPGAATE